MSHGVVLPAPSGWRPGVLASVPQGTAQPPGRRRVHPQMSAVARLSLAVSTENMCLRHTPNRHRVSAGQSRRPAWTRTCHQMTGRSCPEEERTVPPFLIKLSSGQKFLSFLFFIYLLNILIDLLAALGLHCCAWAFSSCGERGLLFLLVRRLLIAVASLVAEHRL